MADDDKQDKPADTHDRKQKDKPDHTRDDDREAEGADGARALARRPPQIVNEA